MVPRALVRPSRFTDIYDLADRLRVADLRELRALGTTPMEALKDGYHHSRPTCWTMEVGDQVAAMFGIAPGLSENAGAIWLLGSDEILKAKTQFLRESRKWVARLEAPYDMTYNIVHQDNELHIKWLKFLGFTFIRKTPPFIEFIKLCVQSV